MKKHKTIPAARDFLIENMEDPMVLLDQNMERLDANLAYDRLSDAIGKAEMKKRLEKIISKSVAPGGIPFPWENGVYEFSNPKLKGPAFYAIQVNQLAIKDELEGFLLIFRNVTVQKEYETRLIDQAVELTIKNEELSAALSKLEELNKLALDANPSTGLPGNNSVNEAISKAIEENHLLCVIYTDLDNFKAYNDKYGFAKGDQVIRFNAEIMKKAAERVCGPDTFIGHVGGDDFVLLAPSDCARKLGDEIIRRFDEGIRAFYDFPDLVAGGIESVNRQGAKEWFPLISISLSGVDLKDRRFSHYLQVSNTCAEVKKRSKNIEGSSFCMDMRNAQAGNGGAVPMAGGS